MKKLLLLLGTSFLATCAFAQPADVVPAGNVMVVRTDEHIKATRVDGRVYSGSVSEDLMDRDGHVAVPRGARVELLVRQIANHEMVIDLESVSVDGRRYGINADADEAHGSSASGHSGRIIGGTAILGTILGAVAGGGKGAAIGAAAGAGAGTIGALATRGKSVNIPAEYLLTFRLERPLVVTPADNGYDRDGHHYHR
jgi:hypothetical protein